MSHLELLDCAYALINDHGAPLMCAYAERKEDGKWRKWPARREWNTRYADIGEIEEFFSTNVGPERHLGPIPGKIASQRLAIADVDAGDPEDRDAFVDAFPPALQTPSLSKIRGDRDIGDHNWYPVEAGAGVSDLRGVRYNSLRIDILVNAFALCVWPGPLQLLEALNRMQVDRPDQGIFTSLLDHLETPDFMMNAGAVAPIVGADLQNVVEGTRDNSIFAYTYEYLKSLIVDGQINTYDKGAADDLKRQGETMAIATNERIPVPLSLEQARQKGKSAARQVWKCRHAILYRNDDPAEQRRRRSIGVTKGERRRSPRKRLARAMYKAGSSVSDIQNTLAAKPLLANGKQKSGTKTKAPSRSTIYAWLDLNNPTSGAISTTAAPSPVNPRAESSQPAVLSSTESSRPTRSVNDGAPSAAPSLTPTVKDESPDYTLTSRGFRGVRPLSQHPECQTGSCGVCDRCLPTKTHDQLRTEHAEFKARLADEQRLRDERDRDQAMKLEKALALAKRFAPQVFADA